MILLHDKEQRVKQLKACCETIIDNAEAIIYGYEHQIGWKIVIDIKCGELPTIKVETELISDKIAEA